MAIWGALIGAGASLVGTAAQIGLGINELKQNKKSLEQAKEALDFQKEQYENQQKNYDGYMQDTQESASSYELKRKEDKDKKVSADISVPIAADLPMDRL